MVGIRPSSPTLLPREKGVRLPSPLGEGLRVRIMALMLFTLLFIQTQNDFAQAYGNRFTYWEYMSPVEQKEALASPILTSFSKQVFSGEININKSTVAQKQELLDSIVVRRDPDTRPFYFFIFLKLMDKLDKDYSKTLSQYCTRVVLNDPEYVMNYLRLNQQKNRNDSALIHFQNFLALDFAVVHNPPTSKEVERWEAFKRQVKMEMEFAAGENGNFAEEMIFRKVEGLRVGK